MVKVNINIQKKDLWLISAVFVFLLGVGFVVAFNQNWQTSPGDPAKMGHTPDEILLKNSTGGTVNIQQFAVQVNNQINRGLSCTMKRGEGETDVYDGISVASCDMLGPGYSVTGGGCFEQGDFSNTGFGTWQSRPGDYIRVSEGPRADTPAANNSWFCRSTEPHIIAMAICCKIS